MQYQLEHHLFPAMPRSKYPKLRSIIKKFANAHDLEYLESGELKILKMNWELYRDVARADPVKGAPNVSLYNVKDKVRTAAL
jgi:fatty acid desaturase